MMCLQKIVDYKRQELEHLKRKVSLKDLRLKAADAEPARDFVGALKKASGGRFPSEASGEVETSQMGGAGWRAVSPPAIIAEVKKASPSAGVIRPDFDPVRIAQAYEENGAAALSILTDEHFFQGSLAHLEKIRREIRIPLLRKDFTSDAYQIYEARAHGADAILLIVRILSEGQLKDYRALTEELGMTALVEVHNKDEMERAKRIGARLIGINNRDLDTLKVDIETSIRLAPEASEGTLLIAESGLSSRADLERLASAGIHAFLIGETLLRAPDPGRRLNELLGGSSGQSPPGSVP